MGFLLGVDGGGTKTAFLLYSPDTGNTRRLITESFCPNDHGIEKFKSVVFAAVNELTGNRADEVQAVCLGIPCYGENRDIDEQTAHALKDIFKEAKTGCVNDCVVGFAGALGLKPGISIVSGTGAIAYGENASGKGARSNGWSDKFSDEGSCCWLGKKSIELFCKQADGRLPKMSLYDIIRAELELGEDTDIIKYYEQNLKGNRKELAAMQKLLFKAATSGDVSAEKAYELAADELAFSIEAVRKAVDLEGVVPVSYAGGLFKTGDLIFKPLANTLNLIYNGYDLQKPMYSPEQGALLMAASYVGADTDGMIKKW